MLSLSGDDCGENGAVGAPGELRAALKGHARAALTENDLPFGRIPPEKQTL